MSNKLTCSVRLTIIAICVAMLVALCRKMPPPADADRKPAGTGVSAAVRSSNDPAGKRPPTVILKVFPELAGLKCFRVDEDLSLQGLLQEMNEEAPLANDIKLTAEKTDKDGSMFCAARSVDGRPIRCKCKITPMQVQAEPVAEVVVSADRLP